MKSSLEEIISQITDFDRGFFRTFIDLFKSPTSVVISYLNKEDTYTKPVRYTFICFSLISIVHILLWKSTSLNIDWITSERINNYDVKYINFKYFSDPFIVLIVYLPLIILLFKVLFRNKSFQEISILGLYMNAQYWFLYYMITNILFRYLKYNLIWPLSVGFIIILSFRRAFQENLLLYFSKITLTILIVAPFSFYFEQPLSDYLFTKFILKDKPKNELLRPGNFISLKKNEIRLKLPSEILPIKDDIQNRTLIINYNSSSILVQCLDKNLSEIWETRIENVASLWSATNISMEQGWTGLMILTNPTSDTTNEMIFLDDRGVLQFRNAFKNSFFYSCLTIDNNIILLTGAMRTNEKTFPCIKTFEVAIKEDSLRVKPISQYLNPSVGQRFLDIYKLNYFNNKKNDFIVTAYKNSEYGVSELSVLKINIDSVLLVEWEHIIFAKTNKFSPHIEYFIAKLDTINEKIISSYDIANTENTTSKLQCIDLKGNLDWVDEIIGNDILRVRTIIPSQSHYLFLGDTYIKIPQHPFVCNFRLGFLSKFDVDGKDSSMKLYGEFKRYSRDYFINGVLKDSTVEVLNFSVKTNFIRRRDKLERLVFKTHTNE